MLRAHKQEFRDLLKRNTIYTVWIPVAFVLVVFLVFLIYFFTNHVNKLEKALMALDYKYVIIGQEEYDVNSFIRYTHLSTVSKNNKRINTNVYMQFVRGNYRTDAPMYSVKLAENEVAISTKVAEKINASVGDTVLIDFSIWEEPVAYVITSIYEYSDDYYDIEKNADFSTIVIGYNEILDNGLKNETVSFLAKGEKEEYISHDKIYTDLLDVEYEKDSVKRKAFMMNIIYSAIFCLLSYILMIVERKCIETEWRRYYVDGYQNEIIKKFHRNYGAIVVLIPNGLLSMLLCGCLDILYIWAVIVVIGYYFIWVRYTKYEKAF